VGIQGDRDKSQELGKQLTALNHESYLQLQRVENKAENRINENIKNDNQSDWNKKKINKFGIFMALSFYG
jgi:hypothetical protein